MKKNGTMNKVLLLLLTTLLAALAAGCGSSNGKNTPSAENTGTAGETPSFSLGMLPSIDAKPKAIHAMYAAYDDAVAYMKSHDQSEYVDTIIEAVGYPETLKSQIQVPDYVPASQADKEQVAAAFAWAKEKGLLTKDLSPEDVISNVQFKE
ncbi:hypothetical protein [Paenibacillus zanthoxyli]|uniref:hypothetical protein n=1 Tax=Paenibacillus zanthoxyli TaxID=369399 RepID=UPI00046F0E5A|nr:hypothetical protein [Paenibacillus zanthoxyli]